MDGEWKAALRLQIEALAKRNELHKRCNRNSVKERTEKMGFKIIQLREMVAKNASEAAQYYLECVCHADETERILNRTSSRDLKRSKKVKKVSHQTIVEPSPLSSDVPTIWPMASPFPGSTERTMPETVVAFHDTEPQRPRWWEHFHINRRDDDYSHGRNERRELWKTQKDFFLSCLGFMVGVGHTMRFPAKVYQHGGGVFFIPYLFSLVFFGLPLVFLHLSIGQYSGQSANKAFQKIMPLASGVGWALVVIAMPVAVYYNMLVAWAVYYFFHSIKGFFLGTSLPWEYCKEDWQLDSNCCNLHELRTCFNGNHSITAPEAFFHSEVLSLSTFGDFSLGPLQPHLVLSLATAWLLIFFGVFKGIGSIGSTMNITATVPYLLLSILLLRGISLPGANKGLSFLFTVDSNKLWSWTIWKSAAEQVFYELGIDAGPLVSMAAFSRFRNNIYRDAALLVLMDAITSTLAGMVIFSFVGFLATVSSSNVNDVLQHDPLYLSFTVYPGVTSFMYWGALWATLFFGMLVLAAIDAELEMIASAIMNHYSTKNKAFENRLLAFLCLMGFLCGLPLCAQGGIFIFHAIENLNANWNSFSLALLTVLIISYFYGIDRYLREVSVMLRVRELSFSNAIRLKDKLMALFGPNGFYIRYSLCFVCPIVLSLLLMSSALGYQRISFASRTIPIEYEVVAWCVMVGPLLVIPLVAVGQIVRTRREGKTLKSLVDTSDWCHEENSGEETVDVQRPPQRRQTGGFSRREHTYMYIDSRGPTFRSRVFPVQSDAEADQYGWRSGRIREWRPSTSTTSPVSSKNSFSHSGKEPGSSSAGFALFGSPPVNPFMLSDAPTIKSSPLRKFQELKNKNLQILEMSTLAMNENSGSPYEHKLSTASLKAQLSPPSPPPRVSPSRSEPPIMHTVRTVPSARSLSMCHVEESHDDSDSSSDSTHSDSGSRNGIRPQRLTVIRRFASDDESLAMRSESISITPLDMARQRSLSSVAIFDQDQPAARKALSKLKRPAPIDAPPTS
ncbi:unnamed protein product [Caenorhabditis auriculariae]|uniref:Transporter n=1 Tax=Caenorhabditis auriculariae TaxID=2777116 RepID=A0A8S1GXV3_9PELO|nr:unnamed protein product [Caenorhabditis auriculariae]